MFLCLNQHLDRKCFSSVFPDAGYLCIPAVLPILKEVTDSYVPEDNNEAQENEDGATTVVLGVVANIFQKIIELLARRLRKEPEEGKQVRRHFNPQRVDLFILFDLFLYLLCLALHFILHNLNLSIQHEHVSFVLVIASNNPL